MSLFKIFDLYGDDLTKCIRYATLKVDSLKTLGLYSGRLGNAIIFYEYSRYTSDIMYEQFADEIIESVLELPINLPYRFSDGLTGIGWGIVYLFSRGFIEGDINSILLDIDHKLEESVYDICYADYTKYKEIRRNVYTASNLSKKNINYKNKENAILNNICNSCFYNY